jgi:hypothetical protein
VEITLASRIEIKPENDSMGGALLRKPRRSGQAHSGG